MSEQTKPEAIPGELTNEQLDAVAGGFEIDGVQPIKPPVNPFIPVDGYTPAGG